MIRRRIMEAAKRFAGYHGKRAKTVQETEISDVFFALGNVTEISYTVIEGGKEVAYNHEFKRPPVLAISSDGHHAVILDGEWRFTNRGFEDEP